MVSRIPVLVLFQSFWDAMTKMEGVSRIMLWLQDLLLRVRVSMGVFWRRPVVDETLKVFRMLFPVSCW